MVLTRIRGAMARSPLLMAVMIVVLFLLTMKITQLLVTAVIRLLKKKKLTESGNLASLNSTASSSKGSPELGSLKFNAKRQLIVMKNYQTFKRFDIVDEFSDHFYCNTLGFGGRKPTHAWTKVINDEWKILAKNLPDTIYARVYERRMDLLRAVMIGPAGTPYHDGLFVFDVRFPPKYPAVPPEVHYHSRGLRINPNLYDCGRVCLSLLNTWTGHGNENWMPYKSTVLQVLVSIQALILNEKPFFNEPGYDSTFTGKRGAKRSANYNEKIFILSLKTMMFTLRTPPQHFEDFVYGHFHARGRAILLACRAYMVGADVGCTVEGEIYFKKVEKHKLKGFRSEIANLMNSLVASFSIFGSKGCEEFRLTE